MRKEKDVDAWGLSVQLWNSSDNLIENPRNKKSSLGFQVEKKAHCIERSARKPMEKFDPIDHEALFRLIDAKEIRVGLFSSKREFLW